GAPWSQPVATAGKSARRRTAKTGENRCCRLRPVAGGSSSRAPARNNIRGSRHAPPPVSGNPQSPVCRRPLALGAWPLLHSRGGPPAAAVAALPELPVGEAGDETTVGGEERVGHRRQRLRQPAR